MTLAAAILFASSFVGILILFAVKKYEVARGTLIGGSARDSADLFALRVKWVFLVIEWYLSRLPDFIMLFTRYGIRAAALRTARLARSSEAHAHRLADLVSHKRNFERRETRSNFLKQVSDRKNEGDAGGNSLSSRV